MKRRRPVCEITGVVLTGCAAVVSVQAFGLHVYLVLPCLLVWASYVALRIRRDPGVLRRWGMRLDNLRPAFARVLPYLLVPALGMLLYRLLLGWRPLPRSFFVVLALYPAWGLAQQFLVQGVVAENLRRLGVAPRLIVPVAALLFGLVHAPDWPLVGLCAVAGLFWTRLFFKTANLIPLGLSHGWLGALVYYWVLERDALSAVFPGGP